MRKKRILWIEDEKYKFRDYAEALTEDKLILLDFAANEAEWQKALKKRLGYYDLVILDILLPKGTGSSDEQDENWRERGESLIQEIKRKWPDTPVVIFSIKRGEEHEEKFLQWGAAEYIEKPELVNKFVSIIYKHLNI